MALKVTVLLAILLQGSVILAYDTAKPKIRIQRIRTIELKKEVSIKELYS